MRIPDEHRCTFTYRDQRRCRMLCALHHPAFCPHHLRVLARERGAALPHPAPPIAVGDLDSARAVRRAMKRVAHEVAAGRMAPRKAAMLVHIGRILLTETRRAPQKPSRPRSRLDARRSEP